jgi:hypothetical protein
MPFLYLGTRAFSLGEEKMFSRALLKCPVDNKSGQSLNVSEYKGEYEISMYYEPIADAFLQLSEDGQSDFFSRIHQMLHKYTTEPEPGMIAMSYEKSIEQLANSLYPEARALIIDLFMAMPLDPEMPDFVATFGKELGTQAKRLWESGRRLKEKMEKNKRE